MNRFTSTATVAAFIFVLTPGVSLAAAGDATEFGGLSAADPTAAPDPVGIAAGPDGNLWFAEATAGQIGRITPSGTVTEFPTPTADSTPQYITQGPDGNMWFTEFDANKIGRITPAGTITEFSIPTPASAPHGIVTGPDGNIWFVESGADKIGMVTPDGGTFKEYSVPANSNPWGIAKGPDGNLWFTEEDADAIGKITPAGAVTSFALPADPGGAPKVPEDITAGPDGAMWFSEKAFDAIGRIPTDATVASPGITEYLTPTQAGAGPRGIVSGPDGNLWFVEETAGKVARITPSGSITEFSTLSPSFRPAHIAVGSDNNLWVTEQFLDGHIARVLSGVGINPPPTGTGFGTGGSGTGTGGSGTGTGGSGNPAPLMLSGVPAHLSTIHRGASATLTFSLSTAAPTVRLTFALVSKGRKRGSRCVAQTRRNRKQRACTRYITKATLTGAGVTGTNTLKVGQALKPGVYRIEVQAFGDAHSPTTPLYATLKVVHS